MKRSQPIGHERVGLREQRVDRLLRIWPKAAIGRIAVHMNPRNERVVAARPAGRCRWRAPACEVTRAGIKPATL